MPEGSRARRTESRRVNLRALLVPALLLACAALAVADPASPWVARWTARPFHQPPLFLRFSPDARCLAVGAHARWAERVDGRIKVGDNALVVLDAANGRSSARLSPCGEELVDLAFTPDDSLAVIFNDRRGAQLRAEYDARSWKVRRSGVLFSRPLAGPDSAFRAGEHGAFSADGRLFAAHYGRLEGEIVPPLRFVGRTVIWNTSDWHEQAVFERLPGADTALMHLTADGRLLVDSPLEHGDREETIRYSVIEPVSRLIAPLYGLGADARLLATVNLWGPQAANAVSPDGRWLVGAVVNNSAGSLLAWEIDGGRAPEPRLRALDRTPRLTRARRYTAIAWSADGSWMAAGMIDGTVRLWDGRTLELVQEVPPCGQSVTALGLSLDGRALAVALEDGRIELFTRP